MQPNPVDMGEIRERRQAVMDAVRRDPSILDYNDKSELLKWSQLSGLGTLGVFCTLFVPVVLLMMRQTPRQQKLQYLKYGMLAQVSVGGLFLYSSYRVSNTVAAIDKKYFSQVTLEGIKNYSSNLYNKYTPGAESVGPALAGMNRQPFGGNAAYYQPPQQPHPPLFARGAFGGQSPPQQAQNYPRKEESNAQSQPKSESDKQE